LYTLFCSFFFCMLLPPPRSPLFPYTTLFRSEVLTTSEFSSEIPKYLAYANAPNIGFPLVVDLFALLITFLVTALVYRGINESRRSEEHTSELQSRENLVCRLLLEKKKKKKEE